MDGTALIQALKEINPAIKIIATSGLRASDCATRAGVKHFLPKPITAEAMLKTVRMVLDETSP
jgi:DNA-binding NtrC family response regulator